MGRIEKFTDLRAWQEGHRLVINIYEITKIFPSAERFGLANQLRRAVVSVTSNIAEGFGRRTGPDKKRFYIVAQGSTTEVQNQLLIARDVGYISATEFSSLAEQTATTHKLITGLIKSLNDTK